MPAPDNSTKSIKLTVHSALQQDIGKLRIRMPKIARGKIGVIPGELILVKKNNKQYQLTVYKADRLIKDENACRLDAKTRNKLNVENGEQVIIEKQKDSPSNVQISAKIDPKKYDIVVVERSSENPFQISTQLVQIAVRKANKKRTDKAKAKAIFDWVHVNIKYGETTRPNRIGYRDSIETKVSKEGVCGEMAFLYVAMARVVGLRSSFVIVDRDYTGKKVNHACAAVFINNRMILADPAYHTFDIAHKKYKVMNDLDAHVAFRSMRNRRPIYVPG